MRHKVFVNELGYDSIGDRPNELRDDADLIGRQFAVFEETSDEIVGAVRCNLLRDGIPDCYHFLINQLDFPIDGEESLNITSRMFLISKFRHTKLLLAMSLHLFRAAAEEGIFRDLIFVENHLVRLYKRFGYRLMSNLAIEHYQKAQVIPMLLDLRKVDYLEKISSPLIRFQKSTAGIG